MQYTTYTVSAVCCMVIFLFLNPAFETLLEILAYHQ